MPNNPPPYVEPEDRNDLIPWLDRHLPTYQQAVAAGATPDGPPPYVASPLLVPLSDETIANLAEGLIGDTIPYVSEIHPAEQTAYDLELFAALELGGEVYDPDIVYMTPVLPSRTRTGIFPFPLPMAHESAPGRDEALLRNVVIQDEVASTIQHDEESSDSSSSDNDSGSEDDTVSMTEVAESVLSPDVAEYFRRLVSDHIIEIMEDTETESSDDEEQ